MFGKGKAKEWREEWVAGATNTCNVTATVGDNLVLNWHGTPTRRDRVLKMFPVIRDKFDPKLELGACADAIIANIHDDGMSPDNEATNIQSIAMLWRVFTTRLDDGVTYGDLITHRNLHATFEVHEQPNDQFKVTWRISVMDGGAPKPLLVPEPMPVPRNHIHNDIRMPASATTHPSMTITGRLGQVLSWTANIIAVLSARIVCLRFE